MRAHRSLLPSMLKGFTQASQGWRWQEDIHRKMRAEHSLTPPLKPKQRQYGQERREGMSQGPCVEMALVAASL